MPASAPAEADRRQGDRGVVGADAGLAAEGPADVRRDHPDVVVGQAECVGEQVTRVVRVLGRDPGGDAARPIVVLARIDKDGVALDGGDRHALVDHPHAHDVVGPDERVGAVRVVALGRDVRAQTLELERGAWGHRRLDIGHHGQVVVVDVDQLGRVDGLRARLRDDRSDDVADEADDALRQRRPVEHRRQHDEALHVGELEVLARVDGEHTRHRRGLARVDRGDARVGDRAPHEHHVPHAGNRQVVGLAGVALEDARVLEPDDRVAEDRAGGGHGAPWMTVAGRARACAGPAVERAQPIPT
jgi:hypothetical protein